MDQASSRPPLEVADILRVHGEEFRRGRSPSARQLKVLRNIETCRTAALGGHRDTCESCGHVRISYNSCRDRHCPKCQSLKKEEWLQARKERLLPVPYFHVVFTIPEELNPVALSNKQLVFDILFVAAAETLQTIAGDPKHLGAQVGFTAILHTWGQKLQFHPHLHCVVTGGGLAANGQCWIPARENFFLPVKVLGRLFRGKFLNALKEARQAGELRFGGSELEDSTAWKHLLGKLYRLEWVVYAKPPFGGSEHVFRYLGRYTHRVAISNHRLIALEDGKVRFAFRDYADGQKQKTLTIGALEFIRRFLLHVLPERFVRIRHYGLMAGRNVEGKLAQARRLLGGGGAPEPAEEQEPPAGATASWWDRLLELTGIDVFACPVCKTGRLVRSPLPTAARSVFVPAAAFDTS